MTEIEITSQEFKNGFTAAIINIIKIIDENEEIQKQKILQLLNTVLQETNNVK